MTPDQARAEVYVVTSVTGIELSELKHGYKVVLLQDHLDAIRAARAEVLQELLSVVEDEEEAGVKSLSTGFLKVILERRKAAALDAGKEG